ncbi:unnamed protein product, partial [Pylaiella littoralis]
LSTPVRHHGYIKSTFVKKYHFFFGHAVVIRLFPGAVLPASVDVVSVKIYTRTCCAALVCLRPCARLFCGCRSLARTACKKKGRSCCSSVSSLFTTAIVCDTRCVVTLVRSFGWCFSPPCVGPGGWAGGRFPLGGERLFSCPEVFLEFACSEPGGGLHIKSKPCSGGSGVGVGSFAGGGGGDCACRFASFVFHACGVVLHPGTQFFVFCLVSAGVPRTVRRKKRGMLYGAE